MYIIGDWFAVGVESVDMQTLFDSVIITNKSIIRRIPTYEIYKTHWHNIISRIKIENQSDSIVPLYSFRQLLSILYVFYHKILLSLDPDIQKHYWAAPFLLPIGTIFVLALIVVLMVKFLFLRNFMIKY